MEVAFFLSLFAGALAFASLIAFVMLRPSGASVREKVELRKRGHYCQLVQQHFGLLSSLLLLGLFFSAPSDQYIELKLVALLLAALDVWRKA